MKRTSLLTVGCLLILAACSAQGEPTIDGSSKESYERSVRAMIEPLSEADKKVFAEGLMRLIISEYPAARGVTGLGVLQIMHPAMESAHLTLNGKTLSEIMAKGREVQAEASKGESVDPEIAALRECLQGKVTLSNLRVEKGQYRGPYLTVDVTNGLSWAIGGIALKYEVRSNGRSVPWDADDFARSISGGIEPGETKSVSTDLSNIPSDQLDQLIVDGSLLDVADAAMRQLIGTDFQVMGWGEERTDRKCE